MQLRDRDLTWQVVGEDVIVLDLQGSLYLKLSGSGRLLWERLTTPATEAELADALTEAYGIERTTAEADVASFVGDLRRRELLDG